MTFLRLPIGNRFAVALRKSAAVGLLVLVLGAIWFALLAEPISAFVDTQIRALIMRGRLTQFEQKLNDQTLRQREIASFRSWAGRARLQPLVSPSEEALRNLVDRNLRQLLAAQGAGRQSGPILTIQLEKHSAHITADLEQRCGIQVCQKILHALETAPAGYRIRTLDLRKTEGDLLTLRIRLETRAEIRS